MGSGGSSALTNSDKERHQKKKKKSPEKKIKIRKTTELERRQEGGGGSGEGGSAEAVGRTEGQEARGHVPEWGWAGAAGFASSDLALEEGMPPRGSPASSDTQPGFTGIPQLGFTLS